jgi:regulator of protease activity HflC (stomatin/prohibitin superfamily)
MEEGTKITLGICAFCVIFITSCGLLGGSFDTVQPNEVGIVFDMNTQHIETSHIRGNGRYLIGLGRRYIKFATTWQIVKMGTFFGSDADYSRDIKCRTKEGMVIQISLAFAYKLKRTPEDLVRLYLDYGENGERKVYVRIALAKIRDVCAMYQASDYYTKRQDVALMMQSVLDTALERVYANVESLELVNLEFDSKYADQIERTQIAKQDVLLAGYEYDVSTVDSEKNISQATTLAEITVRSANATANATLAQAHADANALIFRIEKQTESFLELRNQLNLTTQEELLAYHFISVLQENKIPKVIIALDFPALIKSLLNV